MVQRCYAIPQLSGLQIYINMCDRNKLNVNDFARIIQTTRLCMLSIGVVEDAVVWRTDKSRAFQDTRVRWPDNWSWGILVFFISMMCFYSAALHSLSAFSSTIADVCVSFYVMGPHMHDACFLSSCMHLFVMLFSPYLWYVLMNVLFSPYLWYVLMNADQTCH